MNIKLGDLLREGVYDTASLKCIFLAGGPGSGKSFVANDLFGVQSGLGFTVGGFKIINPDIPYEKALRANGIDPNDLADIEKNNPELWNKVQGAPDSIRSKTGSQMAGLKKMYEREKLGLIIDRTGANYDDVAGAKKHAESLGYDTFMVFVNTRLEVALARNARRKRQLPPKIVQVSWQATINNLQAYKKLFGSKNFVEIDNSEPKEIDKSIKRAVADFIKQPVTNPIGKKWKEVVMKLKQNK
jgi:hypothetical protein